MGSKVILSIFPTVSRWVGNVKYATFLEGELIVSNGLDWIDRFDVLTSQVRCKIIERLFVVKGFKNSNLFCVRVVMLQDSIERLEAD